MTRSAYFLLFGAATLVHLTLNAFNAAPWDSITKCFLAPILVAWVLSERGPKLLAAALVFCFFGDLFLEIESLFLLGMAAFGLAHICFIRIFVAAGALPQLRTKPWIVAILVVIAVLMLAWVWSGLEAELRIPIIGYAFLLAGTAAVAIVVNVPAGIGAWLFLLSDALIAAGLAHRFANDSVVLGLAIMVTYIAAIFLLSTGIMQLTNTRTSENSRVA